MDITIAGFMDNLLNWIPGYRYLQYIQVAVNLAIILAFVMLARMATDDPRVLLIAALIGFMLTFGRGLLPF